MKKFLPLILAVMLVVVMALPVSANEVYTVRGVWTLKDTINIKQFTTEFFETVNVRINGKDCYQLKFKYGSDTSFWISGDYYQGGSTTTLGIYNYYATGLWYPNAKSWDFGETSQVVSETFYNWLVANALPPNCDGTTCPATDLNGDNICDDCGAPFTYNLRNDTYDYNGNWFPSVPDVPEEYKYWHMNYYPETGGATWVASTVKIMYNEDNNSLVYSAIGKTLMYDAMSGDTEWTLRGDYNVQLEQNAAYPYTHVVWANYTITDNFNQVLVSADPNFIPPLWEEMEQVTQGALPNLIQTMDGTILTLVLCGVGLMALLVALKVFGRVLPIFLR